MRRVALALFLVAAFGEAGSPVSAADQVWISDILANPSRFWNTTVTVSGQVVGAVPEPVGTTRGTYTLVDESSASPIAVRTNELPPIGQVFTVSAVVIQDPAQADVPLLKELKRTSPGVSALLRVLLIAGGSLFLVLLVVFLVLLMRPPARQPLPRAMAEPAPRPPASPPPARDDFKTAKLQDAPEPISDKTQVFMSLGAEMVVEKGPDKGREFPLHKQVTTIGRPGTRKNDIELTDSTVSKEQAAIYYDTVTNQFSVANQSSTNPTSVDKTVVSEPVVLQGDAVIDMGQTSLRFRRF